ncbi:MAG: PepSY domain-containing protein [Azonexus sp.]|jgi:uncharacterized membrane protein YkoI|nr:PepSY domain-containing protein [Azonexus sp.]
MKRKTNITLTAVALALFGWQAGAVADTATPPKTKISLEAAQKAALAAKPGKVVKVELKREKGQLMWEFDIEGEGKAWDVEVNASTGKVNEIEQEVVSADDPMFKAKAKVSLEDAQKTALKKYPGKIKETEYEIESDGKASYEFDIVTTNGKEMKVEVDATSGKIVEASPELWQSGDE